MPSESGLTSNPAAIRVLNLIVTIQVRMHMYKPLTQYTHPVGVGKAYTGAITRDKRLHANMNEWHPTIKRFISNLLT